MAKARAMRIIAGGMSLVLFISNTGFTYQSNFSIWSQRGQRPTQQLAQLPLSPPSFQSSIPKPIRNVSIPNPTHQTNLNIPSGTLKHLTIRNITKGTKPGTILLLEDVHGIHEAQNHISDVINLFGTEPGAAPVLIGLEGAVGAFAFRSFQKINHYSFVKDIISEYFKAGEISGPAKSGFLFSRSEKNRGLFFWGVDDSALYRANVNAYRSSQPAQKRTLEEIQKQIHRLAQGRTKHLNPDLATFDIQAASFHEGSLSLGKYLTILQTLGAPTSLNADRFLTAYELENQINLSRAESERQLALSWLGKRLSPQDKTQLHERAMAYEEGTLSFTSFHVHLKKIITQTGLDLRRIPNYSKYLEYVLLAQSVDATGLMDEVSELENAQYKTLITTPAESNWINALRLRRLAQSLVNFSMTPNEWNQYVALNQQYDLSLNLEPFENFYKSALKRNDALAGNFLAKFDEMSPTDRTGVLVAGGYHTGGMATILKKSGFTVITATPKITKIDTNAGSTYLSAFQQEKQNVDRHFSGKKLFLVRPVAGANSALLPELDPTHEINLMIKAVASSENELVAHAIDNELSDSGKINTVKKDETGTWVEAETIDGKRTFHVAPSNVVLDYVQRGLQISKAIPMGDRIIRVFRERPVSMITAGSLATYSAFQSFGDSATFFPLATLGAIFFGTKLKNRFNNETFRKWTFRISLATLVVVASGADSNSSNVWSSLIGPIAVIVMTASLIANTYLLYVIVHLVKSNATNKIRILALKKKVEILEIMKRSPRPKKSYFKLKKKIHELEDYIERFHRELKTPGAGNLPVIVVVSDQHGAIDRFDELIVAGMRLVDYDNQIPKGFKLNPSKNLRDQLPNGLKIEILKERGLFFMNLGDYVHRGPDGHKVLMRSRQLKRAGLAANITGNHDFLELMNLQGFHLPWYEGYNIHGYVDEFDKEFGRVDDIIKNMHSKAENSSNTTRNKVWWARQLYEFETFHKEKQDKQWKQYDLLIRGNGTSENPGLFNELSDLVETVPELKNLWGDPLDDNSHLSLWNNLRGNKFDVDIYTGVRAVGQSSLIWWQNLYTQFKKARAAISELKLNTNDARTAQQIWDAAIAMMENDIIPVLQQDIKGKTAEGLWWWRIFEALNAGNYQTAEWYAKDSIYHKGWGTQLLDEYNRDNAEAIANKSKQERTQENYLGNTDFATIGNYFKSEFNLWLEDFYKGRYLHAFLPIDMETGEFFFEFENTEYRGKEIWKGLDLIGKKVRETSLTNMVDLQEAFYLYMSWYADNTTKTKPQHIEAALDKFGAAHLAKMNGFRRLYTGHVPIDKLGKHKGLPTLSPDEAEGRRIFSFRVGNEIFFTDHSMAKAYGYHGGIVVMNQDGLRLIGFETDESTEPKENPQTWNKENSKVHFASNKEISREKFLELIIAEHESELQAAKAELKRQEVRYGFNPRITQKMFSNGLTSIIGFGTFLFAVGSGKETLGATINVIQSNLQTQPWSGLPLLLFSSLVFFVMAMNLWLRQGISGTMTSRRERKKEVTSIDQLPSHLSANVSEVTETAQDLDRATQSLVRLEVDDENPIDLDTLLDTAVKPLGLRDAVKTSVEESLIRGVLRVGTGPQYKQNRLHFLLYFIEALQLAPKRNVELPIPSKETTQRLITFHVGERGEAFVEEDLAKLSDVVQKMEPMSENLTQNVVVFDHSGGLASRIETKIPASLPSVILPVESRTAYSYRQLISGAYHWPIKNKPPVIKDVLDGRPGTDLIAITQRPDLYYMDEGLRHIITLITQITGYWTQFGADQLNQILHNYQAASKAA